ncbi:carnitine O-acetyltransferase isoform X1 [Drosophila guanche]|uniref:Blast:Carnitine O-acetyltransferase n=2 Tax=Drosophila guanche TaxID=7266 RepID=A0A3B0KIG7_DROGU|nr:carnitine O-acetyltransferase isoform X1 [Drosophila guanche]SPP85556.1 blast:Carnitine O-acetyltransferase [Drosophila guanche]
MYKYQSSLFDKSFEKPSAEMRYLGNGKVLWNLTKNSISHQSPNALANLHLHPASYSSSKKPTAPPTERQKQNLLTYHVLPLDETLNRFTSTVEPLLTPEEFKLQKKINDDFKHKEGDQLQMLLEDVGKAEKNWLAPRWLKAAYLQYRSPVTVYVSPGMTFPRQNFKDAHAVVDYTSKVIFGLGEFNDIVHAGKIPVVKMGKNELDNGQFGKVFGTCRIPKRITDELVYNPRSNYVVVIYKNHFYKMQLYNKEGKLIASRALASQLEEIVAKETTAGVPYGILTTDTRDNWAEAYEHLSSLPGNKATIDTIQGALFTVSLDECTDLAANEESNELILGLIHGGGSKVNSGNRWMDKTIQLVVNPNGNVGFTYEHSPAEGQPIAMMMDYVVKKMKENASFGECGATDNITPAEKLSFCPVNECIEQWLFLAKRNIDTLAFQLQMKVLKFEGYGKGFIKKQRLGPDSFVQMALQLAFYKMHNEPAAQYESAHLRIFEGGRTETIRSCSNESLAFCRAMQDDKATDQERVDKLRAAVNSHQTYTRLALQGKGVDRHLLGLKLMAVENGKPVPEFFSSPGVVKSSHFRMSTSQVATTYDAFMGYGPAVDDGYACCYNPREQDIILAISAWRYCQATDHLKFAKTLEQSFLQMKDILEKCPAPVPAKTDNPKSKL